MVINSPGGSVYEGIAIFNTLRKAAEAHPVRVWINGLAASMASYIAIAARAYDKNFKITVNENSIFFIHNPWNYSVGDYRAFQKQADYLDRLAKVCGLAYAAVSGADIKDIRSAMDEETYYIGQEIIDAGFANDFEQLYTGEDTEEDDRDVVITQAWQRIEAVMKSSREHLAADDAENAVALFNENNLFRGTGGAGNQPEGAEGTGAPREPTSHIEKPGDVVSPGKEGVMKLEELAANHPDCYQAALALGVQEGIDKERKRVSAHIKVGKESGNLELAAKFITEGKSVQDDEVHAEYMAAAMKTQHIKNRLGDDPPATHTGGDDDLEEKDLMKAFDLGVAGKEIGKGK